MVRRWKRFFKLLLRKRRRKPAWPGEGCPGDSLRVATQAVIPTQDKEFRVVHDGTHGVQVNNEIVIQKLCSLSDENVIFGLVGDVSKAQRHFLYRPEQWGILACRTLWLNRTGAFRVAAAAFWFSRLIGLVGRLSFRVTLNGGAGSKSTG